MIVNDNAVLTVRNERADLYEDGVNSLIEKGYTVKTCGYTGLVWWAIMENAQVAADMMGKGA